MAPVPYLIGSKAQSAGPAVIIPVTTATTAGDAIIVGTSSSSGGGETLTSVTDSKGNSYSILGNADTAEIITYMAVALNTAGLAGGDTITVTWSQTTPSLNAGAIGCPGVVTAGAVDQAVHAHSAGSNAPSVTSGTLAQAGELCIAVCGFGNPGANIIWPLAWSSGTSLPVLMHTGSTEYTAMAAQVVSSTSAVTASGSLLGSAKWAMLLATLQFAAAPTVVSVPVGQVAVTGGAIAVILSAVSFPSIPGQAFPGQATPGDPGAPLGPAPPPPTAPYLIGIESDPAGSASTVAGVIQATAAGVGVVVAVQCSSAAPTAVTDTQENVYALAVSDAAGNEPTWLYVASSANPLATTDAITVSWSSTSGAKNVIAVSVPGITGALAVDVAISADGASFFPSLTSGTLAQASETAIAVISSPNSAGAITWAAGWAAQGLAHNGTTAYTALAVQQTTTTAPVTASGTLA